MKKTDIIIEKLNNFIKFVDTLPIDNKEELKKLFNDQINDITLFMFGVTEKLLPHYNAGTLDSALDIFAQAHKIDKTKLTEEQINKIKKYIEFFCVISC